MRSSALNLALKLPIPIIDVSLHRFSEPGLKQENPTLFVWDIRHLDRCHRFKVICDEQRELAASMLKQQLLSARFQAQCLNALQHRVEQFFPNPETLFSAMRTNALFWKMLSPFQSN
jgi:hypothetical protein